MTRVHEIAATFRAYFDVLAIGLYGSLARGDDGPYSDIEMYCVVRGEGIDEDYEWSEGAWKAEVNVQSPEVIAAWAAEFDEFWPLTHGACVNILPIFDPTRLFESLKGYVFDHPDEEYNNLIREVIIGELYEFLGKIRNTAVSGKTESLPALTVEMVKYGAYVIGLANRKLYTSSATMFSESRALTDKPLGYDQLCELVTSGRLESPAHIAQAAERFWEGIEAWAGEKSIPLYQKLSDLLE